MGLQWFKDFGNVKNKDKEPYQPGAKNWNRNELQDIAAGLEKAFKDLDPVGYRQYRILVYGQEEEHSLSVNKCDEEDFEKMGGSADLSIAVGFSEVVDESQSKITYSLASVRTVVDGMRCIDSGKEKEKEKQVHYETWGLQHIPTHKEIHWRRSIFFNLKVWRGMTCYSESWSLQPLASHPTEIAGIRQRFKDVTRRKQYGCSIGMEIKADRDVEWKMQEDYLRGVVEILGEMAEESILCLCRMRGEMNELWEFENGMEDGSDGGEETEGIVWEREMDGVGGKFGD